MKTEIRDTQVAGTVKRLRKPKSDTGMVENTGFGAHIINAILGLLLLAVAFACLVPMWHVLMSSFSNGQALLAHSGVVLFPVGKATVGGYSLLFKDATVLRSYLVTILYVVGTASVGLVLNVLAGFVLSRPSKLKGVMTMLVLISTMFNGGLIPTYMVVRYLGLTGTPLAIILPSATNAIFMIMVMNSFLSVPQATVEAATMDGAGHLTLMFRVMLPQARGLVLVTVIQTALATWNSWFEASIYLPNTKNWWPLQLVIKDFVSRNQDFLNYANPDYNRYLVQYAVIIIATVPVLLILPFIIRKLEENMVMGAVKG